MNLVKVGEQGRIVIPQGLRTTLNLQPGDTLLARVEDGQLILETPAAVEKRLFASFAHVKESLATELMAERRSEAAAEVLE